MSFIDLMSSNIWTEADITRRTEAMIRSKFSVEQELIINRKLQGAALGQYILSDAEKQEIAEFQADVFEAQQAGDKARADMILLNEILQVEPAYQRLQKKVIEPILDESEQIINQEEIDRDIEERARAEETLVGVSEEARDWLVKRNPVVEEAIEEVIQESSDRESD